MNFIFHGIFGLILLTGGGDAVRTVSQMYDRDRQRAFPTLHHSALCADMITDPALRVGSCEPDFAIIENGKLQLVMSFFDFSPD